MFGFKKNTQERIEPEFDENISEPREPQNLADILGAEENDTNITAGVDAILDEEGVLDENQPEINQNEIDLGSISSVRNMPEQQEELQENNDNEIASPTEDLDSVFSENSVEFPGIDAITDTAFENASRVSDEDIMSENNSEDLSKTDFSNTAFDETPVSAEPENYLPPVEEEQAVADDILSPDKNDSAGADDLHLEDIWETENEEDTSSLDDVVQTDEHQSAEDATLTADPIEKDVFIENQTQEASVDAQETTLEPFVVSQASSELYDGNISDSAVTVETNAELWSVQDVNLLSSSPKVINQNSGFMTWTGDKYQSDIKIELQNARDINKWKIMILHGFSVPLAASATEVVVDKSPETVRYATLMHNGEEKLKIFNQRSYKFIAPQGEFFTVQGNVICGRINEEFSLNIQDYVCLDIHDKINKFIQFKQPASGLILGPDGVTMFFTMARGVAVVANNFEPETDVFEYIPSVKKFDSRTNFVYDETMTAQEFVASGKRTGLIVNTGSSLFGWNVRFDNEKYLSLKDTLTYQAKNNALPSPNGELVHEDKVFKFFGVEKIQVRQKVVYYSYGRV